MSNTQTVQARTPWKSVDFIINLILLALSAFGFTQEQAGQIAPVMIGIAGAIGILRDFFKDAKFVGIAAWLKDSNTWSYIASAVVAVFPAGAALIEPLKGVSDAIVSGNFASIITALFALGTIIFNLVKNRPNPA